MISDALVYASLRDHFSDLPGASQELVNKANQAGGKDNITVVILQIPPTDPLPAAVPPPSVDSSEPTKVAAAAAVSTGVSAAGGFPLPAFAAGAPPTEAEIQRLKKG